MLSGESATDEVMKACARWQHEYIGAVYVSGGEAVVRRFVAAGCSPRLVTFYDPARVRGLGELNDLLEQFGAHQALPLAELIAVAPTDVLDAPRNLMESARSVVTTVNRALGSAELPVPRPAPALAPGNHPAQPSLESSVDSIAWGSDYLTLECGQQTDLLLEALRAQQYTNRLPEEVA